MILSHFFFATAIVAAPANPVIEETENPSSEAVQELAKTPSKKIEPFTGKVIGSKVRLRLTPSLDGLILKELTQGDLLVVTGEADDFYCVRPEKNIKGFIYRAYVLDGVVEANNVNLRIEADTQSPIITQLNQGSKISGTISPKNNKWLMVDLPEDVRFYVAKDYVNKVGDLAYFHRIETKREYAKTRFNELQKEIAAELKKPFPDIDLAKKVNELKALAEQNQDLPEYNTKALALVKSSQDEYLLISQSYQVTHRALAAEAAKEKSTQIAFTETPPPRPNLVSHSPISFQLEQQEAKLLAQSIEAGNAATKEAFYATEYREADELQGQLIPYSRAVKNRPGDFMLVDAKTKVPLAYLYSNRVDLSPNSGKNVRLIVAKRPNHNFALPAFFVLEIKAM